MREQLLEILEEIAPEVEDFTQPGLVTNEILDSFMILNLVSEISDEFGVDIEVEDMIPENFDSLDKILELIESRQ